MLREFARSHGLDIPRLSTTQHSALSGANRETFNAVLDELIPEQGHVVEANTDAFRAVFDSINEDGALAGLRPDAINPRPFYQGVSQALTPLLNAANEEGNAVDAAQLRQLAGDVIGAELLGLKDTLDDIGALPAERFSDADKDVEGDRPALRRARCRSHSRAFTAAKELPVPTGLVNLARLDQTPGRFTQAVMDVSERFCAFHERYAQLPGSEDLLPMMCDFILEGMTPDELANVSANMQSDMAHKLAGACLHIVGHPRPMRDTAPLMGATQIMNNLRQNAEYRLGHNPQVDPMYFNDEINHLCEMPGDAESPLSRLGRFAPGVITDFDVQMNRHAERLTPQQWEQLRGIHTQLAQTAQGAQDFLLPYRDPRFPTCSPLWRPTAASRFPTGRSGMPWSAAHAQGIAPNTSALISSSPFPKYGACSGRGTGYASAGNGRRTYEQQQFRPEPQKAHRLDPPPCAYLSERHLRGYGYGIPERH
ncbi:MAG: hypothetical protein ACLR7Z_04250 [Bilophila wadsworthia]